MLDNLYSFDIWGYLQEKKVMDITYLKDSVSISYLAMQFQRISDHINMFSDPTYMIPDHTYMIPDNALHSRLFQ